MQRCTGEEETAPGQSNAAITGSGTASSRAESKPRRPLSRLQCLRKMNLSSPRKLNGCHSGRTAVLKQMFHQHDESCIAFPLSGLSTAPLVSNIYGARSSRITAPFWSRKHSLGVPSLET